MLNLQDLLARTDRSEDEEVAAFWLALDSKTHFGKSSDFDEMVRRRFGVLHAAVAQGQRDNWRNHPLGALALVIVLDQFSRNIARGSAVMFANDSKALEIADDAIVRGYDQAFINSHAVWFYMPFMHSERLADQKRCVALCRQAGLEETLPFAIDHMKIIERFGRFPHRNAILGRPSMPEERAFLAEGGFAG